MYRNADGSPRIIQIAASKHGLHALDDSGNTWILAVNPDPFVAEDKAHEWRRLPSLPETK